MPNPPRRNPRRRPLIARRRTESQFLDLVERALDSIPQPFARALDEVVVVMEDEPSAAQRRESGLGPNDDLYGLFEGVPRTEWAADWAMIPNKITLFRLALEEDFPDRAELEQEVRITVLHELGHYLGIDDDRLNELGAY
jgi:predicted Zn-dependent protease with MMP-like domain